MKIFNGSGQMPVDRQGMPEGEECLGSPGHIAAPVDHMKPAHGLVQCDAELVEELGVL